MTAEKKINGDYVEKFLSILNNKAKYGFEDKSLTRTNGFVVLVRGGKSVKPIRSLCLDQKYNRNVLTARYRLRPDSVIGTLFTAFFADLQRFKESGSSLLGDFVPNLSDPAWQELLDSLQKPTDHLQHEKIGTLDKDFFNKLISSEFPIGSRLVLFGEVSETPEDMSKWKIAKKEWQLAEKNLFSKLPERMGLVLSGFPEGFNLPVDNPHYLELDLSEENIEIEKENDYKLKISSIHSDKPATKDYLGVYPYAEALARFVLHPQTEPPITMGIHGPWGKGKSSFMEFVDIALVKWAKTNRKRMEELNKLDLEIEQEKKEIEKVKKKAKRNKLWKKMQDNAKNEVVTIRFNAWQYEDSKQIWAGLASIISESLERVLPLWSRIMMPFNYALKEHKYKFLLSVFLIILILILSMYSLYSLKYTTIISPFFKNFEQEWGILLPAGTALFLTSLIWRTTKLVQPISKHVLNYIQLPNYREQMGYQHKVMKDLIFVYDYLQHSKHNCKVVVFIDDLDRCSEEKIMEILHAINLILAESNFFVFLGMETDMIYRAIRIHYSKNHDDVLLPKDFTEKYLRKIIQLSFYIPMTPDEKRREFLCTLFSTASQDEFNKPKKNEEKIEDEGEESEEGDSLQSGIFMDFVRNGLEKLKSIMKPINEGELESENETPHVDIALPYDLNSLDIEVEDTAVELKMFSAYQTFMEDNPREIKRLVNTHRLIKIILQQKYPDMLWPIEWQSNLVRWLIFCTNWPDSVDDVLAELEKSDAEIEKRSLEELINKITIKNLPRFIDFINYKPEDDEFILEDFKLDISQLEYFKLAAQISQKLERPDKPAPKKKGHQTTLVDMASEHQP